MPKCTLVFHRHCAYQAYEVVNFLSNFSMLLVYVLQTMGSCSCDAESVLI